MKYLPWKDWAGKADTGLQLTAPATVESLDNRTLRFTISTSSPDREKDVVNAAGWDLDAYRKNPVVLWAHDYRQPPIARAVDVQAIGDRLVASAEFVPADISPFADSIYRLIKAGFLNGTSVGFRPLKWAMNTERGGMDFENQELLEFSVCSVPVHPQALIEARAAGIDTEPLRQWAEASFKANKSKEAAMVLKAIEQPTFITNTPGDLPAPAQELPVTPPPASQVKTGRVLSGRNESALRDSLAALNAAMGQLQTVLAQVGTGEDGDGEKPAEEPAKVEEIAEELQPIITITDAAEAQVEKDLIVFRLVDDPEPRFELDPAMVSEVIAREFLTRLATVVDTRVGAAISALRGRID